MSSNNCNDKQEKTTHIHRETETDHTSQISSETTLSSKDVEVYKSTKHTPAAEHVYVVY